MQLVTVVTSLNVVDADLANSRLASAGFHPTITHGIAAMVDIGFIQSGGGILVQVPEDEAASAREFLASTDQAPPA